MPDYRDNFCRHDWARVRKLSAEVTAQLYQDYGWVLVHTNDRYLIYSKEGMVWADGKPIDLLIPRWETDAPDFVSNLGHTLMCFAQYEDMEYDAMFDAAEAVRDAEAG